MHYIIILISNHVWLWCHIPVIPQLQLQLNGGWRLCSGRCLYLERLSRQCSHFCQPISLPAASLSSAGCLFYITAALYPFTFAWDRLPLSANSVGYFGKFYTDDEKSMQCKSVVFAPVFKSTREDWWFTKERIFLEF